MAAQLPTAGKIKPPPPFCEARLAAAAPPAGEGRAVFFIEWQSARPPANEGKILRRLLQCRPAAASLLGAGAAALVLPRFGVVSPWSSKATDIARGCGVSTLLRVERGRLYSSARAAKFDPLIQQKLTGRAREGWRRLFARKAARQDAPVPLLRRGKAALLAANAAGGLALSANDIAYLLRLFAKLRRDPTMAELQMFAQANSEHCRHKIFNTPWQTANGGRAPSLMQLIRKTHAAHPRGVVTAFADNAAVIEAPNAAGFFAANAAGVYARRRAPVHIVAKAETHNHPTAISPFAGAATGVGGEIRDEAAAGRGAVSLAGFSAYAVSHIPPATPPLLPPPPSNIAAAARIAREAPLGAAAYNNEFGRPTLAGFFCSLEVAAAGGRRFGFHKPLMLAGGVGQMTAKSAGKRPLPAGAPIVQLGGPGFCIGLGGGSASSGGGGKNARLDFASVQRDNAEMQRRAQEAIDALRLLPQNPVLSLHDVGAGGLANAVAEIAHAAGRGFDVELESIPLGETGMSPAQAWCNEAQERYVLALAPGARARAQLEAICERERCPFAVLGRVVSAPQMRLANKKGEAFIALPTAAVFDNAPPPPPLACPPPATAAPAPPAAPSRLALPLADALQKTLAHPSVACKRFLITIGDRHVGGLTAREQMVGPWQTPVADCAAVFHNHNGHAGVAFALGEQLAAATANPAAAARLAIAEAMLNLAAADVAPADCKLCLNWIANCANNQRNGELRQAAQAASDFCQQIGAGVIVGKDSLFMSMPAPAGGAPVESPAACAAFAFAPIADARRVVTPQLRGEAGGRGKTVVLHLRFGNEERLGMAAATQCAAFANAASAPPDIRGKALAAGLRALAQCKGENLILACHDCSRGGLWAALCEMAFAANCGIDIFAELLWAASHTDGAAAEGKAGRAAAALLHEEPAMALEVAERDVGRVMDLLTAQNCPQLRAQTVARVAEAKRVTIFADGDVLFERPLASLRRKWEAFSASIAAARDNPQCARQEQEREMDEDPGLFARLPAAWRGRLPAAWRGRLPAAPRRLAAGKAKPRVAILREQGVNGNKEMAAAFVRAGFVAQDITMADLQSGRARLDARFAGAALAGGFSFGDVLGAGRGWAHGALNNERLRAMFSEFFALPQTFVLGVCNGCQALAQMQPLMPNAAAWSFPQFLPNASRRFEARLLMAEVLPNKSPLFANMAGLLFPIVVAHGEGRAVFARQHAGATRAAVLMRYVNNHGKPTMQYPYNPNGSPNAAAGFASPCGRFAIAMPHPERVFRAAQMGWLPPQIKGATTPWLQIFINARRFAEQA